MRFSVLSRILWVLVAAALLSGVVSLVDTPAADASQRLRVDFTVRETGPLAAPGEMLSSNIPGCASATVTTVNPVLTQIGSIAVFTGSKIVDCQDGNTFSFVYWAWTSECRRTDRGGWALTGGTGLFAGARGFGRLVGSFFKFDGSPATYCDNDGIDDRWRGVMWLP